MLLSRFWYFALAVSGTAALAAFLLTQAAFNRQYDASLTRQLRRDRFEIELMLRMDARARLDAIAPIAAHPDIRSGLQAANGRQNREAVPEEVSERITEKLTELNNQLEGLRADILFAVDARGDIIAHLNAGEPPAGSGIGAFPLVERALAGFIRDDVWVWNDSVYRMAARPVIQQGRYVGAIVHGMRLDDTLANRLSERVGEATVAFFHGDRVIGRHMPGIANAATADEVEGKLAHALAEEAVITGGHTEAIPLTDLDTSRGVFSLVTGSASHAQVGYAIARPVSRLAGVTEIFDQVAAQDVQELPWPLLGGGAFLAFLLAMAFMWLERDRPVGKLKKASAALKNRELSRYDVAKFGGSFRKIAQMVNDAMDAAVASAAEAAPRRQAADLDEILGPTPDQKDSPQFFGFSGAAAASADEIPSAPPPPADVPPPGGPKPPGPPGLGGLGGGPPGPPGGPPRSAPLPPAALGRPPSGPGAPPPGLPARPPGPLGGAPRPPPGAPAASPKPPAPAPAIAKPAMPSPGPAAPPPAAGPPQAAGGKPAWAKGTMLGMGAGDAAGAGPLQSGLGPAIGDDDDDEVATTVAPVPKELLESVGLGGGGDEQDHFREVYERFIATKRECGEPTTGLTYEKFEKTLKKNRDTIISRHDAKSVRFTVYVKDGKAALKASPIR